VHNHESSFHSPFRPPEVLEAFRQLAATKRWQVTWEDDGLVHVRSGPTLRGAGEDIEVSAAPDGGGSQVRVAVRSRLGWWQLIDRGGAGGFYREILATLEASEPEPRSVPAAGRIRVAGTAVRARGAMVAPAAEISHLHKAYGETVAVDDVSFSVAEGEILGLLGPNGAGKTTTVECAVGLRAPDAGSVRIFGLDPIQDREQLRLVVGVQLQSGALPARMKAGELLELYASFYSDGADVEELALLLGIAEKRHAYCRNLSGGQKQRLSIALALIGRPRLAVLDEMTTGLDPHARRETWDLMEQVRDRGVTILLVTHYMEEAERLCDKVVLLDRGRVVAAGTPEELSREADARKLVRFVPSETFDDSLLTGLPEVAAIEHHGRRVEVSGTGDLVNAVIQELAREGVVAHDVELASTSLEDAFVQLTGGPLAAGAQLLASRGERHGRRPRERRSLLPAGAPRQAFVKLLLNEARQAWRQPIGLGLGLVVPFLMLALWRAIPSFQAPNKSVGGVSVTQAYLPIFVVFTFAAISLWALPVTLATYREQGILRRLSTTPVPPAWLLGAQLLVSLAIALISMGLLLGVGIAGFGLRTPRSPGGLVAAIVLAGLAALAIGLCIAGTARTAGAAGGMGFLAWYPLMFFAGLFLPLAELPSAVREIAKWTPFGAGVDTVQRAIQTGFPTTSSLLTLAAYAVVFGALSIRYFRWE
jgi:ABC-2 type transport system ATP-binding protein